MSLNGKCYETKSVDTIPAFDNITALPTIHSTVELRVDIKGRIAVKRNTCGSVS